MLITITLILSGYFSVLQDESHFGSFTDPRDGQIYKTVKIGNQVWMAENLRYKPDKGSWCYDDMFSKCDEYGRLYNWKTAKQAVPPGWRLPGKAEFEELINFYHNDAEAAYADLIHGGKSGFEGLFAGWRYDKNGQTYDIGTHAFFWTSELCNSTEAWRFVLNSETKTAGISKYFDGSAYSVRCVKE
jgi:uncharacterized protein (TIGR02145 family)